MTRRWLGALLIVGLALLTLGVVVGHTPHRRTPMSGPTVPGDFCVPPDTPPSGQAPPLGDTASFRQLFVEDFSCAQVDSTKWAVYRYGGNRNNWRGSQIIQTGGVLTERASKLVDGTWASGAVSLTRDPRLTVTYGRFLVRTRCDPGVGIRCVLLLWPVSGWPPEVDFDEIGSEYPTRLTTTQTVHYGTRAAHGMVHTKYPCTCAEWHTLGLDWTPGSIVYTYDGVPQRTVLTHVPTGPMNLRIQQGLVLSGTHPIDATTPAQVDQQVDWVSVYSYVPGGVPQGTSPSPTGGG